jgi:hypothetical protein
MFSPYRVLITHSVLGLERPSSRERKLILSFLEQLSLEPFHTGDYSESDQAGRILQVKIIGRFALTYRSDHSEREVKVFRIERAD